MVRNGGLRREGIGTSMMMQLVDCTIDTSWREMSVYLRREVDFKICIKTKESVINKEIN